jgi:hypothetical protein
VEHRTQFQIDRLDRSKGVLHSSATLVGTHRGGGIGLRGRQMGAHDVDAVECGFCGNGGMVADEAERVIGDRGIKVFGHSRVKCPGGVPGVGPNTAPRAWPMAAAPRSGLRVRSTRDRMRTRSVSVAASSSSRLRARSAASSGLRQTTRRSPG